MSQLVDRSIRREQALSTRIPQDPARHMWPPGPSLVKASHMIKPYDHRQVQSASYDVRLGREVRTEYGVAYDITGTPGPPGEGFFITPGGFVLGHTEEYFRIPAHLCARVEGKSTVGRRGLAVHVTAGFIDPGFNGQITLELVNHSQVHAFEMVPGMLIAQITFHRLTDVPERLYGNPALGSHYQGQTGATAAVKPSE